MAPDFPLLALSVLFLCRAEYTVSVQSVRSADVGEPQSSDYPATGCKISGTDVKYRCANSDLVDNLADLTVLPQLLTMRVDCRGTHGDFQNLTLYGNQRCGRLTYRKYGNSSKDPTEPWLPLINMMTIEKDTAVDIQCLLGPITLDLTEYKKRPERDGNLMAGYSFRASLLLDGEIRSSRDVSAYDLLLYYPPTTLEACGLAVEKAYMWNMTVEESTNNSYLVRFASPKFNIPAIFPPLDLVFETGEIFRTDKDWLHISVLDVLYGRRYEHHDQKLVTLDETFYNTSITDGGLAVEVKLDVNVAALQTENIHYLKVQMGFDKGSFWIFLPVEAGQGVKQNHLLLGFMILFIFLVLGASLCYVYREDMFAIPASFHFPRAGNSSIEMQRPMR